MTDEMKMGQIVFRSETTTPTWPLRDVKRKWVFVDYGHGIHAVPEDTDEHQYRIEYWEWYRLHGAQMILEAEAKLAKLREDGAQ